MASSRWYDDVRKCVRQSTRPSMEAMPSSVHSGSLQCSCIRSPQWAHSWRSKGLETNSTEKTSGFVELFPALANPRSLRRRAQQRGILVQNDLHAQAGQKLLEFFFFAKGPHEGAILYLR